MSIAYSPRQRQRIRERLNKARGRGLFDQYVETFTDWDGVGEVRVPVSAKEAAMAHVYGYATVSLEGRQRW
jgi:hypothetical protein